MVAADPEDAVPLVHLDDRPIHYVDRGGDAPAVICVHSLMLDHRMFTPVVSALGADARAICPDLPGFGGSPVTTAYDAYDLAALLIGLLDHVGVDRAALVGVGLGGLSVIRAALAHPERITGLVSIGVQYEQPDELTAAGYRSMSEAWGADGPTDALADAVAHAIFGAEQTLAAPWLDRWRTLGPLAGPYAFAALVGADPISHRLGEIRCPARVLHGARDEAVPREISDRLAARLSGAGPVETLDGPHALTVTHPAEVAGAIRAVLR